MRCCVKRLGLMLALCAVCTVLPRYGSAKPRVRNLIVMIGDGMGVTHLAAAMEGNNYEPLAMERAVSVGLVKTRSANNRVTDSAAAATAYATGHKTRNGTLGLDSVGNRLETILEKARDKGLGTGLVVTSDITGATPAGYYAHVAGRSGVEDIALQLAGAGIDVWMGGGKAYFSDRRDGRDLTEELARQGYSVVYDMDAAERVPQGRLAGLFSDRGYLGGADERGDYLPRATAKALELLKGNKKGFFLMVEGSQVDIASHAGMIGSVRDEVRDFDDAVCVAFDFAERNPGTLVVVLADHETGGLAMAPKNVDFTAAESGIEYLFGTPGHTGTLVPILGYGTGCGNFSGIMENTRVHDQMCRLLGFK